MSDDGLFDLDELPPWQRQPGEPARAFEVFRAYLEMGPGRSLRKLHALIHGEEPKVGRRSGQIGLWSRTHNWTERVAAWDDLLAAERRRELRAENIDAARRQAELGALAQQKVHDRLAEIDPRTLAPGQLAALAMAGVRIERLALGMDLDSASLDEGDAAEFDETPETMEAMREYARRHAVEAEELGTPS